MILEAVITKDELKSFLERILPVTIDLTDGRWLRIDRVTSVAIVADRGVVGESSAELYWPIVGVDTGATLPSLQATLIPRIGTREGGDVLEIALRVENAEIKNVPALLEPAVIGAINLVLESNPLVWNFSKLLGHEFACPARLGGIRAITTKVLSGEEHVTEQALALTLLLDVTVARDADVAKPATA